MKSKFPGNMHICTLCPKYLQSVTKFHSAVEEELRLQTVHYYIQNMAKVLSSKGPKFPSKYPGNMHIVS